MPKKKIFFMMSAMSLGGAETALLGLLEALDYTKVEVDLFLYKHTGELMPYIPKEVNILPENSSYSCMVGESAATSLKRGHILIALMRAFAHVYCSIRYPGAGASINGDVSHKCVKALMPQLCPGTEYDLAVSFVFPHYFVHQKIRAKRKIAWIHTDYTSVKFNQGSLERMWNKYDKIISISQNVSDAFVKAFPTLNKKLEIIENILPIRYIRKRSQEIPMDLKKMQDEYAEFKLLSIGRFSHPKNYDNVPEICLKIRQHGLNVKWFLIGYGRDEALIREKIKEYGMDEYVVILGKQDNPYPFIKHCDLYVQPSRYEGKSVAVREAQLLGKPVIITAFPTAHSQLNNGVNGLIVPMDNEGCANGIVKLLRDKRKMSELAENCRKSDIALIEEVEKFYQI